MKSFNHFDRHSLIKMVKELLELDDRFDHLPNHRTAPHKKPFKFYCLENCRPTNYIMDFEFVTDECCNIFCTNSYPCADCLSLIDRLKFYMRAIKIINIDPVNGLPRWARGREYIKSRNKASERGRRSKRKRRDIKDKWRKK